jgi:hypothetical protein
MEVLLEDDWHCRRDQHYERVRPWVKPRLQRTSRNAQHPIDDFLFEYYANPPAKLLRWHPGLGVVLAGESARQYLSFKEYSETREGITAGVLQISPQRLESVRWLHQMLRRTAERAGIFGCWGLHEWAMIYGASTLRHREWPLRVTRGEVAKVVESFGLRCTHYDAFRFFTPVARPLNRWQPTRATTVRLEQPACLHANMDLYKWAFKLAPFTASELVADCFELAVQIRALDMQASPYDFTALGYPPIPIERPEGRAEYEARQRHFASLAAPLRRRLAQVCEQIIERAALLHRPSGENVSETAIVNDNS